MGAKSSHKPWKQTSGICYTSIKYKWLLGLIKKPDNLIGSAPKICTVLLPDVKVDNNQETFYALPLASLLATVSKMIKKFLNLVLPTTKLLPQLISWVFTELPPIIRSLTSFSMIPLGFLFSHSMPAPSNKVSHFKTILLPVNPIIVVQIIHVL